MKNIPIIILVQILAATALLAWRYLLAYGEPNGYAAFTSFPAAGSQALLFLGWNLFLALVPYALSLLLPMAQHRLLGAAVLFIWLLFLPNAPYLITDLIHLRPRPPVPIWADILVFFFFAWTGLLLGLASLLNVQRYLLRWHTIKQTHFWIIGFAVLSSFGLYLGRVDRWNSWEAFLEPMHLLRHSLSLLSDPPIVLLAFLGFFTLLQGLGYAFFYHLSTSNPKTSTR
ncbi:MAG: DUF1361 domain-containing protein [Phaeodactylibacter sp.]|uniref:DUF1361 domain-containing protein n=1 Tax=Phaeodactylibacter sp. TaxID=1940289 RepID=UPI0032EED6B9